MYYIQIYIVFLKGGSCSAEKTRKMIDILKSEIRNTANKHLFWMFLLPSFLAEGLGVSS